MTQKEKRQLAESSRFYSAASDRSKSPDLRKAHPFIPIMAGIILTLSVPLIPDSISGSDIQEFALQGAARLAKLSAMIELWDNAPFESNTPVNNSSETGNNIITPTVSENDMIMLSYGSRRMPSSLNEEIVVAEPDTASDETIPLPYPDDLSDNDGAISRITYQMGEGESYIDLPLAGQLRNVTSLSEQEIYENAVLETDFTIELDASADNPQILIMHTHTTESYEAVQRDFYDKDFDSRTTDGDMNVTAVGKAMAQVFEENGIRVIHDTTIHDNPSYNGSYDRSRETVAAILEQYPSIKVVLDVHRDAIERESGERIAPATEIDGKSCAQVMLICGCDDGTMNMPECMKNLRTAALFEQYMESMYPTLTRPVLYDYRQYNQDMTTGSLLIEVGGHANSIDEAVYAGELSARAIAQALISRADNA